MWGGGAKTRPQVSLIGWDGGVATDRREWSALNDITKGGFTELNACFLERGAGRTTTVVVHVTQNLASVTFEQYESFKTSALFLKFLRNCHKT